METKMITKEYVEDFLTKESIIRKKIEDVFLKYYEITIGEPISKNENITEWYIENDIIYIETFETWSYGGFDNNHYELPVEYLYSENWELELKEKMEKNDRT
jgi:hypothetical protein